LTAIVVKNEIEVANRLEQLGWNGEQLLEIADAMAAARNSCTDNDPAGSPGWMAWKEGTRRFREIGLPMGLSREDIEGIPWTTDMRRKLRFAVVNTDAVTGLDMEANPQNRSKKGPGTERAVSETCSMGSLLDGLPKSNVIPISSDASTARNICSLVSVCAL